MDLDTLSLRDILGCYECRQYVGTKNENGWHFVMVTLAPLSAVKNMGEAPLKWITRAGPSWSLTPSESRESLAVGTDCPYFKSGHTCCKVSQIDGELILHGPHNERFYRVGDLPPERQPNSADVAALEEPRALTIRGTRGACKRDARMSAFIMPLPHKDCHWMDLAYLAAIPASSRANGRQPVVIAPFSDSCINDDAVEDYLRRLEPNAVKLCESNGGNPLRIQLDGPTIDVSRETYLDLEVATISLAKEWSVAESIVLVSSTNYANAVLASSFASRIDAPIFYIEEKMSDAVIRTIESLCPVQVFVIGDVSEVSLQAVVTHLRTATDVIDCLRSNGYSLDYVAIFNPNDRCGGISQKLSLTAPLYTTRREGLAIPLPEVPIIPNASDAKDAVMLSIGFLQSVFDCIGKLPEHLALVGSFDVVPVWQTDSDINGCKNFAVTDIPYGQPALEKHFREIAVGRIFTDCICSGSLLAARTVTYELLKDGTWDTSFIECGAWGFPELRPLLQNAGFAEPRHLLERQIEVTSHLEVAAILHKDHSGADGLGNAINTSTATLYAPAILLSRGCHAAGIDEKNPSVAGRMLGRGAVAYVGSPRSPSSANTFTEIAFWNALLLEDMTIGQAMRAAFNKATTNWLDKGAIGRYCLENEVLLGDPALRFTVPGPPRVSAAVAKLEGDVVTVSGPGEWAVLPIVPDQLKEWKYKGSLFTCAGPGAEPETHWCGEGYDRQTLYFSVALTLPPNVEATSILGFETSELKDDGEEVTSSNDVKHWWSGRCCQHVAADGTRSLHWRIRLLDYDQCTGHIKRQLKTARFRLVKP
eukprot:TRINITY_DN9548_c0_g1_i2.p1 TRINITY_DN9548_c0_g1~~TRINITY_DN9548_c0_g1_i2.p1  ORF type:complete len:831 (+),score=81.38 TRINITY_DN9548_c0_g1_i2:42-2495(+)